MTGASATTKYATTGSASQRVRGTRASAYTRAGRAEREHRGAEEPFEAQDELPEEAHQVRRARAERVVDRAALDPEPPVLDEAGRS